MKCLDLEHLKSYSYGTCKVLTQHVQGGMEGRGTQPSCKEQKCKFESETKPRVESERMLGEKTERL